MSNLYIITGPAGVGKSTISKQLAKRKEKSVLIEGDDIYNQVVGGYVSAWKEGNHLEIFWRICKKVIKEYLDSGYDVIFNYIISNSKILELKKEFSAYSTKFVVLLANEETLLERDKQRPEDCQMKERCIVLLNNFKQDLYDKKYLIYTDNMTVESVVTKIEKENGFFI